MERKFIFGIMVLRNNRTTPLHRITICHFDFSSVSGDMALEALVSSEGSNFGSKSRYQTLTDDGCGDSLIGCSASEIVLPSVERPMEFATTVRSKNPFIKYNKGYSKFVDLKFFDAIFHSKKFILQVRQRWRSSFSMGL